MRGGGELGVQAAPSLRDELVNLHKEIGRNESLLSKAKPRRSSRMHLRELIGTYVLRS